MNRTERRKAIRELKKRRAGMKMKKYDITDKLSFEDNPVIKIKDIEVEINADAKTVIEVGAAMDGDDVFAAVKKAYNELFSEADKKKIDKLKLKANDFKTFINAAVVLAMGGEPDGTGEE